MNPENPCGFKFVNLLNLIFICLQCSVLGCTFLKLDISPAISPLEEKIILGEGDVKVLLIDIDGIIVNREKRTLLGKKIDIGMIERIREILQKAEDDPQIMAILLRINSPGGTVTASDIIYHELKAYKENSGKKIYAVLMDVAASGGYYIAMSADSIMAHPTTITGSIGVISMKPNLKGLMKKIGIDMEVVKSANKKDFLSPFRSFTDEERKLFQEAIDSYHNRFIRIIDDNRSKITFAEVQALADGRIYNAEQALRHKLIDQIGYLDDSVEMIKNELRVPVLKIVTYFRNGDYKNTLYSGTSIKNDLSLLEFDLTPTFLNNGQAFFYLWAP